MKRLFFLIALFVSVCTNAQTEQEVFSVKEVDRIINFLASDEMKGRRIYSPEIDSAANFIAKHFEKAGLKTLNNSGTYFQTFYTLSPRFKGVSATIDSAVMNPEQIIAITPERELEVTEKSGYTVSTINAGDNLFRRAYGVVQSGSNNIVLVDSSHAEDFKRLVALKRNLLSSSGSAVFILGRPEMKHFKIHASHEFRENKLQNVVGVLPGISKPDEYVIFSAHYDHVGIGKPENGDSIYNGANDDASGTTAVMLLADYFARLRNNERSIIFVAFTAEESGGFGSRYFSKQLQPEKIIAMLNIEMIGTDSKWGKNSAYITGFERSGLGKILQENLRGSNFCFMPDPYPEQQLFFRSDNATLAMLGVPAHTISTSKMDNEPHYHKPGDEVKTLDLVNMTEVIKSIARSARSIISGTDTPTRVNIAELKQ